MNLASFLIDTDWVIDHFNRVGAVTQRLQELVVSRFLLKSK